jgi:hypothetical protein
MAGICTIYDEVEEIVEDRVAFTAKYAGNESTCVISRGALELLANRNGQVAGILEIFATNRDRIAEATRKHLAMNLGIMPMLSVNNFQV